MSVSMLNKPRGKRYSKVMLKSLRLKHSQSEQDDITKVEQFINSLKESGGDVAYGLDESTGVFQYLVYMSSSMTNLISRYPEAEGTHETNTTGDDETNATGDDALVLETPGISFAAAKLVRVKTKGRPKIKQTFTGRKRKARVPLQYSKLLQEERVKILLSGTVSNFAESDSHEVTKGSMTKCSISALGHFVIFDKNQSQ
ncbi:hypothetical protein RRG08_065926 [Elysia crispata]|uniref:Uncharacterized protein n=1 Tax=Elysia crispata TaxID=231223 RepID=A0AAE1DFI9_9GAST|nr:hypothetical protein RRG08_065926 [Elysia crispata]